MGKPFTPERLANIRRIRKARRLYRKQPLFAYVLMLDVYPCYTHEQFLDDLRLRKPPKKKKGKNPLVRYGRYNRMQELNAQYSSTGNIQYAVQAQKLRQHLTKPYRVMVKVSGCTLEYGFSPLIPIKAIEQLVGRLAKSKDENEADKIVEDFRKTAHIN